MKILGDAGKTANVAEKLVRVEMKFLLMRSNYLQKKSNNVTQTYTYLFGEQNKKVDKADKTRIKSTVISYSEQ